MRFVSLPLEPAKLHAKKIIRVCNCCHLLGFKWKRIDVAQSEHCGAACQSCLGPAHQKSREIHITYFCAYHKTLTYWQGIRIIQSNTSFLLLKYTYIYRVRQWIGRFCSTVFFSGFGNTGADSAITILLPTSTLRLLMSYIYGAPILDVSRSHTTTQHSR